ncbi:hypothetical protein CPB83DRAFT_858001, partial [Crepidotus variabilis]
MALMDLPNSDEGISCQAGPSRRPPTLHLSETYLSAHTSRHVPRSLSTSTVDSAKSVESPYNLDTSDCTSSNSECNDSEDLFSTLSEINLNVEHPDLESRLEALDIPFEIPFTLSDDTVYVCLDDQDEAWYSNLLTTNQPLESASFRVTTRLGRAFSISSHRATPQAMRAVLEGVKSVQLDVDLGRQRITSNESKVFQQISSTNLRDLSWTSCGAGINDKLPSEAFPWRTLRHDLPWNQLTHISMDCPLTVSDIHHILSTSSNLKSLTMNIMSLDWIDQSSSPSVFSSSSITAPSLQTLSITSISDLHSLFADVIMPELTRLSLDVAYNGLGLAPSGGKSPIDAGLNIPWGQLQHLDIQYRCFETCYLSPILSRLRSIRTLSLDGLPDSLNCANMLIPVSVVDRLMIGRGVQSGLTPVNLRVTDLKMTRCVFDPEQISAIKPINFYLGEFISVASFFRILEATKTLKTAEFSLENDVEKYQPPTRGVQILLSSLKLAVKDAHLETLIRQINWTSANPDFELQISCCQG